jgi:hypothetical protein
MQTEQIFGWWYACGSWQSAGQRANTGEFIRKRISLFFGQNMLTISRRIKFQGTVSRLATSMAWIRSIFTGSEGQNLHISIEQR